jgi:hypothetical protein
MRAPTRALVVVVLAAAVVISGAIPASTVDTAAASTPTAEAASTFLDLFDNDGKTIRFRRNEGFYLGTAWTCERDSRFSRCMSEKTGVFLFMIRNGTRLTTLSPKYSERNDQAKRTVERQWVVDFPDGFSGGTHTFGAVWIFNAKIHRVAVVTVRFNR